MTIQEDYGKAYEAGRNKTARFLIARGFSRDLAEEVTQAAWVCGWEKRNQLKDPQKQLVWINTIALNIARSDLRRCSKVTAIVDPTVDPLATMPGAVDVRRKLQQCSDRDQALMIRYYWQNWSIDELARHERCTHTAMRLRLFRARQRLGQLLERRW